MQAIRVIINKYFEVINNNHLITLRDFLSIYRVSLLDLEYRMCDNHSFFSTHSCYCCKKIVPSIIKYLNNCAQTLMNVIYILKKISPIKSEKQNFDDIFQEIRVYQKRFLLINIYFQYKIITERVEELRLNGENIPQKLNTFIDMSKDSFKLLKVSLDISLVHFFNVYCEDNQMMFFDLYVNNPNHGKNINKKYSKYFHKIFRIYGDYFDYDVSDSGSENSLRPHVRYSSDFDD